MKKLFPLALVAAFAIPLCAETAAPETAETDELALDDDNSLAVQVDAPRKNSAMWPAFVGVWEFPETPDLVGVRFTIPWSTKQENITGFDLGLWGRCLYFEGVQVNLLRNDVVDDGAGVQVGIYNSIGHGDMLGVQVGLWNEALCLRGVQAGLINVAGDAEGFQVGLINRAESLHGYQLGLVNVIRSAEFQFFPIINIGF